MAIKPMKINKEDDKKGHVPVKKTKRIEEKKGQEENRKEAAYCKYKKMKK